MTIWILTVLLLASLGALGYRQGAIRVAFSLVGIIAATLLALPLSPLLKPLMPIFGVKNLLLAWVLPPFVVFVLINAAFKAGALPVHRKVDVFFKYKAGDLHRALFERLNARLGLCLGLVNGTVYLILIAFVVYMFGYWTVQMASSERETWTVRLFNRLARDLQATGLTRVARAVDPLPEAYYDAADFVGLVYHNPLAEGRLARYPALLRLGERPEFQQLAKDTTYINARQTRAPVREVLSLPQVEGILQNTDLLREIWAAVGPDLKDLMAYLQTGKSEKYDREPILGCWSFDFPGAFALYRKANPKLTALQLREHRKWLSGLFLNTTLVVGTDGFAALKGMPRLRIPKPGEPAQGPEIRSLTGKWTSAGGGYELHFEDGDRRLNLQAQVDRDRLTLTGESIPLVFERDT